MTPREACFPGTGAETAPAGKSEPETRSVSGAAAETSAGHCARARGACSVSPWHMIHLPIVSDICQLQFYYTQLSAYVNNFYNNFEVVVIFQSCMKSKFLI